MFGVFDKTNVLGVTVALVLCMLDFPVVSPHDTTKALFCAYPTTCRLFFGVFITPIVINAVMSVSVSIFSLFSSLPSLSHTNSFLPSTSHA